jgi:hypothetical protein
MSFDCRTIAQTIWLAIALAVMSAPAYADPFEQWDACVKRSYASQRIVDALRIEPAFASCTTYEEVMRADALALVPTATTEEVDRALLAIKEVIKAQLLEQSASAARLLRQSTDRSIGVFEWCRIEADGLRNPWQFLLEAMKQGCLR